MTARSPQAGGRVERGFGTLRDRLRKALPVRGVASRAGANRYLEEEFLPLRNERLTVDPADHPRRKPFPVSEGAPGTELREETTPKPASAIIEALGTWGKRCSRAEISRDDLDAW